MFFSPQHCCNKILQPWENFTAHSTQHTAHSTLNFKPSKLTVIIVAMLFFNAFVFKAQAQLNATLSSATSYVGYDISCHGAANGRIELEVSGGTAPYTFLWNDGSTTQNRSNLSGGNYSVTITDAANHTVTKTIKLLEPAALNILLSSPTYDGGFNVSKNGVNDGSINTTITGGTPPYSYQWNQGSNQSQLNNLRAGSYTLTITDVNQCNSNAAITLTESNQMQINSITLSAHHGYNTSCTNSHDGNISIAVSGGTGNYSYHLYNADGGNIANADNQGSTYSFQNLGGGVYSVTVSDDADNEATSAALYPSNITLSRPPELGSSLAPSVFGNFNLSCYTCHDGAISTTVTGGVTPYHYTWVTGQHTANITGLDAGQYMLTITDAAGCAVANSQTLTAPQRDDWTMNGNTGSNPATNYIGTADNQDLVIKTNATEAMRVKANGDAAFAHGVYADTIGTNKLGMKKLVVGVDTLNMSIGFVTDTSSLGNGYRMANLFPSKGDLMMGINGNGNHQTETSPPCGPCRAGMYGFSRQLSDVYVNGGKKIIFTTRGCDGQVYNPLTLCGCTNLSQFGADVAIAGSLSVLSATYLQNELNVSGTLTLNGEFIINNTATNNKIFEVHQADNYVYARDIHVTQNNFPDYVFAKDYKLMGLKELENYINAHHHLPEMPTAKEVADNNLSVSETTTLLTKKIEELTLYMLELKKENEEIKAELKSVRK